MEIKITVKIGDKEPIEVKVDAPEEGEIDVEIDKPSDNHGPYTMIFDEACVGWTKYPDLNKVFLIQQQEAANFRLQKIGCLFLNDVYDMLGYPRTRAGQVVGWIYDKDYSGHHGFVDFGIFKDANIDFINGRKNIALLNFNVDGDILNCL